MEEGREEREDKRAVSLQLVYAQEPKKLVRVTGGTYINSEELTIIWVD